MAAALGAGLCLACVAVPTATAATGSISGAVTDSSTHAAVAGVKVCAWKISGSEAEDAVEDCVSSGEAGGYEIASLGEGTYKVEFRPRAGGLNYVGQFYRDERYWGSADPVYVGAGTTPGIDAALQEGGEIEGRVTSDVSGSPITGVLVCAERELSGPEPGCALTGVDGRYDILGMREGEYKISFDPHYNGLPFIEEFYDDQRNERVAQWVQVTVGSSTRGIDAALEPASEIRGTVTAAASGAPLAGIMVCAAPPLDYWQVFFVDYAKCAKTDSSGNYSFGGLVAGEYGVMFSVDLSEYIHQIPPREPEEDGYPTIYWNQKSSWGEADVLTLTAPTTATNVDARLGPPPPAPAVSPAAPPAHIHRCKPGRRLNRIKGRLRCVKPHRRKHHHRHHHRRAF